MGPISWIRRWAKFAALVIAAMVLSFYWSRKRLDLAEEEAFLFCVAFAGVAAYLAPRIAKRLGL